MPIQKLAMLALISSLMAVGFTASADSINSLTNGRIDARVVPPTQSMQYITISNYLDARVSAMCDLKNKRVVNQAGAEKCRIEYSTFLSINNPLPLVDLGLRYFEAGLFASVCTNAHQPVNDGKWYETYRNKCFEVLMMSKFPEIRAIKCRNSQCFQEALKKIYAPSQAPAKPEVSWEARAADVVKDLESIKSTFLINATSNPKVFNASTVTKALQQVEAKVKAGANSGAPH